MQNYPKQHGVNLLFKALSSRAETIIPNTEDRGMGNSAKGKEEQKPVTTVALDRVCVWAWLRYVCRCMCACICQENVYVNLLSIS